jgi:hypothetical protein
MNEFVTVVNGCPEAALRLIAALVTTWSGNFTTLHFFISSPFGKNDAR